MKRNSRAGPGGGQRGPAARWLAWAGAVLVLVGAAGIATRAALAPDREAARRAAPSPTGAYPRQTPHTGPGKAPTSGCLAGDRAASGRLTRLAGSVPTYRLQT